MKIPRFVVPYWPLVVVPCVLFAFGFLSNAIVMAANGGQMPVLWPGGCFDYASREAIGLPDRIHTCMTSVTNLKFLADWVVINGLGIASPGDFLEWASDYIWAPCMIAWLTLMLRDRQK